MTSLVGLESDPERELRALARSFAREKLEPLRRHVEDSGDCRPLMAELGAAGLIGTMLPTAYGGAGGTLADNAAVVEEIGAVIPSLGAMRSVAAVFVGLPLSRFGTPAQLAEWLPPLISGERTYALGLTEPGAGSDATGITTRAVRAGDGGSDYTADYVITGYKHYISGAAEGQAILSYVVTDPEAPPQRRFSAFLVPTDSPGLDAATAIPTMGLRGLSHAEVHYRDVRVPASCRVGAEGQGWEIMMMGLGPERVDIAARALGCAARALEEARAHAGRREQFGRPIRRFQAVSHLIADMRTTVDAARLLVLCAARAYDAGAEYEQEAAMAKLFAAERGWWVCDASMEVQGALGYTQGSATELMLRDIRALRFGGGTDEIMRHVVQREEFRRHPEG